MELEQPASSTQPEKLTRPITHNALIAIFGQSFQHCCLWLLFVSLGQLGGSQALGHFTLAFAIVAPCAVLLNFQLGGLLASEEKPVERIGYYIGLRLFTATAIPISAASIAFILGYEFFFVLLILSIGCARAIDLCADVLRGGFIAQQKFFTLAFGQSIRGFLGLIGSVCGFYAWGLMGAGIGLGCGWLIGLISSDIPRIISVYGISSCRPRGKFSTWAPIMRHGFPLGVVSALLTISVYTPIYALSLWSDSHQVGQFSSLLQLLFIGTLAVTASSTAAIPKLIHAKLIGNKTAFIRITLGIALLGFIISICGAILSYFIGEQVIRITYGPDFSGLGQHFTWLCLAMGPSWFASGLGVALTSTRHIRGQPYACLAATIVAVIAAILLVPPFGLIGAIATTACSALILAGGYAWLALSSFKNLTEPNTD